MAFDLPNALQQAPVKIDKFYVVFMTLIHAGALAALFYFSWLGFALFLATYVISGMGITIGYHRLLTHRSFRVPMWLERFFALCGASAFEGGPISWVANHRQHHNESDTPSDPHDIHRGLAYAHFFWIFNRRPKWFENQLQRAYAPELLRSGFYRFLERFAYLPGGLLGLGLLIWSIATGDPSIFLWGLCFRVVFTYHATWLVNSAAHYWGYRYFSKEVATNNWWVALLAFGEGWHNNHHAFPTSARHGLRFWEFDSSWIVIWTLAKLRLARNLRLPERKHLPWTKESLAARIASANPVNQ
jgi:fatty-acid desaturase